jgi:hypothetical protein
LLQAGPRAPSSDARPAIAQKWTELRSNLKLSAGRLACPTPICPVGPPAGFFRFPTFTPPSQVFGAMHPGPICHIKL